MTRPNLDDPTYRAFAWRRFGRLMIWMVFAALVATAGGLWLLSAMIGPIPIHIAIATGLGVFFAVLLAALLMGLAFLSSGSGHDDTIHDPFQDGEQ